MQEEYESGAPNDEAYRRATERHPIDGATTVQDSVPNKASESERIAVLEHKLESIKSTTTSTKATYDELPKKLWGHVLAIFLMMLTTLGAFYGINTSNYSGQKDSLGTLINENTKTTTANHTNIVNFERQFSNIEESLEKLGDSIATLTTQIAVLDAKSDAKK